jgi:hypothetical protein
VGDGTTSVCILAAELLREAEKLVNQKIHPQTIIEGYRLASKAALDALDGFAVDNRLAFIYQIFWWNSHRLGYVNTAKTRRPSRRIFSILPRRLSLPRSSPSTRTTLVSLLLMLFSVSRFVLLFFIAEKMVNTQIGLYKP